MKKIYTWNIYVAHVVVNWQHFLNLFSSKSVIGFCKKNYLVLFGVLFWSRSTLSNLSRVFRIVLNTAPSVPSCSSTWMWRDAGLSEDHTSCHKNRPKFSPTLILSNLIHGSLFSCYINKLLKTRVINIIFKHNCPINQS
jgi:hypothetical protein